MTMQVRMVKDRFVDIDGLRKPEREKNLFRREQFLEG